MDDYKNLIKNFIDICAVPRGSGHNEKISAFLCEFAKNNGLEYIQDEALNVVIKKPASPGFENAAPVILQGHMDMVCVKNEDVDHDFETQGLELIFEENWLRANGTTLGGDDGIACAMMLSLLADKQACHPALVCIMTTDEETGMDGAKALDPSVFDNARFLLNLDSENESECLCGCAGGLRIDGRVPVTRSRKKGDALEIVLSGLRGGHSGGEIHRNITNAVRLLGRILFELKDVCDYRVISASGGEKDNAIPAFARALILLQPGYDKEEISVKIDSIVKKYIKREPDMKCSLAYEDNMTSDTVDRQSLDNILYVLLSMPNGVQAMSADIEGLVETSLNLGIFEILDKEAVFHYSLRSSAIGEKEFLSRRVRLVLESVGGFGTEIGG